MPSTINQRPSCPRRSSTRSRARSRAPISTPCSPRCSMRASSGVVMLDDRPDDFGARNLFLQALLGLISASRRLDAALAKTSPATPVPLDEPFLLFVLGLVAFRRRAGEHIEAAEAEPRHEAVTTASTGPSAL